MKNKNFIPVLKSEIEDSIRYKRLANRFLADKESLQELRPHPNRATILAELIAHNLDSF